MEKNFEFLPPQRSVSNLIVLIEILLLQTIDIENGKRIPSLKPQLKKETCLNIIRKMLLKIIREMVSIDETFRL